MLLVGIGSVRARAAITAGTGKCHRDRGVVSVNTRRRLGIERLSDVWPNAIGLFVALGRLVGFLAVLRAEPYRQRAGQPGIDRPDEVAVHDGLFLNQRAELE